MGTAYVSLLQIKVDYLTNNDQTFEKHAGTMGWQNVYENSYCVAVRVQLWGIEVSFDVRCWAH